MSRKILKVTLFTAIVMALLSYAFILNPDAVTVTYRPDHKWTAPLAMVLIVVFAIGARRLTFSALGLLQYIAPSIQFLLGLLYGEPFTALRGVSFALIWAGLLFFSWDAVRKERALR